MLDITSAEGHNVERLIEVPVIGNPIKGPPLLSNHD